MKLHSKRPALKALIVLLALSTLLGCNKQQEKMDLNAERIKQDVMTQFESLVAASKSANTEAYFAHFDKTKFVGLNADGSNWNSIDDLRALVEPGFAAIEAVETLHFPNVKISVIDAHTAILVNEYQQSLVLKGGNKMSLAGGGTQVWSKASGTWKLVSVSASNSSQ